MSKLLIIGISDPILSAQQEKLLGDCTLIVGAKRFREIGSRFSNRFHEITPLEEALGVIRTTLKESKVAVLASGDPLFYGIGRRLLAEFSAESVEIYPALSSIQRAASLFRLPWDDAAIISLHGRTTDHIPGLLLSNTKNLILTDKVNSPDRIAKVLLEYLQLIGESELQDTIRMMVAEDIGLDTEKIFSGTLLEGCKLQFSPLNIFGLLVPESLQDQKYRLGLTEDDIHHSRGLITKNEVRAATLHQLRLPARGVFWDVGAGSGSLSIEAAKSNPELTVYAIEHKAEELENIKNNIVKFRCYNIVPVFGRAPEMLETLPDPDSVFVGGSSGSLPEIVAHTAARIKDNGSLVINGVIEKTVQAAPELLKRHGFHISTAVVKVTRTEPEGKILDFYPITIMTGRR